MQFENYKMEEKNLLDQVTIGKTISYGEGAENENYKVVEKPTKENKYKYDLEQDTKNERKFHLRFTAEKLEELLRTGEAKIIRTTTVQQILIPSVEESTPSDPVTEFREINKVQEVPGIVPGETPVGSLAPFPKLQAPESAPVQEIIETELEKLLAKIEDEKIKKIITEELTKIEAGIKATRSNEEWKIANLEGHVKDNSYIEAKEKRKNLLENDPITFFIEEKEYYESSGYMDEAKKFASVVYALKIAAGGEAVPAEISAVEAPAVLQQDVSISNEEIKSGENRTTEKETWIENTKNSIIQKLEEVNNYLNLLEDEDNSEDNHLISTIKKSLDSEKDLPTESIIDAMKDAIQGRIEILTEKIWALNNANQNDYSLDKEEKARKFYPIIENYGGIIEILENIKSLNTAREGALAAVEPVEPKKMETFITPQPNAQNESTRDQLIQQLYEFEDVDIKYKFVLKEIEEIISDPNELIENKKNNIARILRENTGLILKFESFPDDETYSPLKKEVNEKINYISNWLRSNGFTPREEDVVAETPGKILEPAIGIISEGAPVLEEKKDGTYIDDVTGNSETYVNGLLTEKLTGGERSFYRQDGTLVKKTLKNSNDILYDGNGEEIKPVSNNEGVIGDSGAAVESVEDEEVREFNNLKFTKQDPVKYKTSKNIFEGGWKFVIYNKDTKEVHIVKENESGTSANTKFVPLRKFLDDQKIDTSSPVPPISAEISSVHAPEIISSPEAGVAFTNKVYDLINFELRRIDNEIEKAKNSGGFMTQTWQRTRANLERDPIRYFKDKKIQAQFGLEKLPKIDEKNYEEPERQKELASRVLECDEIIAGLKAVKSEKVDLLSIIEKAKEIVRKIEEDEMRKSFLASQELSAGQKPPNVDSRMSFSTPALNPQKPVPSFTDASKEVSSAPEPVPKTTTPKDDNEMLRTHLRSIRRKIAQKTPSVDATLRQAVPPTLDIEPAVPPKSPASEPAPAPQLDANELAKNIRIVRSAVVPPEAVPASALPDTPKPIPIISLAENQADKTRKAQIKTATEKIGGYEKDKENAIAKIDEYEKALIEDTKKLAGLSLFSFRKSGKLENKITETKKLLKQERLRKQNSINNREAELRWLNQLKDEERRQQGIQT